MMQWIKHTYLILWVGISFSACMTAYIPGDKEVQNYRIDPGMDLVDEEMISLIKPYKDELGTVMEEEIGVASINLKKGKAESLLGNFIADAIMTECKAYSPDKIDFATQNYGGIRIGEIPAGPITRGKIFELMPFENFAVILEIRGDSLLNFFERIDDYGGWPLSKEVLFEINKDGSYHIEINGKEVEENKIYRIAMPDYIANGGDKCIFFKGLPRYNTGVLIRDMIIEHIVKEQKAGRKIQSKVDGRMNYIK